MVNAINSSLLLANNQPTRKTGTDVLGKDDFLKILMTQLQNQDPMNPMQDKDFIAQMATFTSLEQITNMGKSIDSFVKAQEQSQLVSYNQYIGKEVSWQKVSQTEDGSDPVVTAGTGKVVSLQLTNSTPTFILEDGTTLTPENISQINETSKENQMLQASQLIGKLVTYTNENNEQAQAKVLSVSFKDGKTLYQLQDEQTITGYKITKIE